MTTHILPLTYAPKIEAVKAGTCRQTIRRFNPEKPKHVGDKLILHTWAGKPYRTPWDWRLETTIRDIRAVWYDYGWWETIWSPIISTSLLTVSNVDMEIIAQRDGIDPPTRDGLEATLMRLNGLDSLQDTRWEVIRW